MEEQMSDKRAYLVGGMGCAGKSTFAKKLAEELGVCYIKADDVYFIVSKNLNIPLEKLSLIPMQSTWENPGILGDDVLGVYPSIRECVKQAYLDYFSYNLPDKLVIEGEAIFWNTHERALVEELFSEYNKTYFCVYPEYEQWLRNRTFRIEDGGYLPVFREQEEYKFLYEQYLTYMPEKTFVIKDILNTDCSLTGGVTYQSEDFSNPKWEVFNFPKNMNNKTFLDISCNTGWFSKKASEQGAKVFGLDISWQVLNEAYNKVLDGTFTLSRVEDFEFKFYDYILCSSAFHYYTDREKVIEKISKATTYFVLETPVLDSEIEDIQYDNSFKFGFCALVSEPLLLKWLKKYFKDVEKIGETIQPNSRNRNVYRCTQ